MASKISYASFGFFIAASTPLIAYCETYLTEDQAIKVIFPGETFTKKLIQLTPADIQKIEEKSGQKPRSSALTAYVGSKKNMVFIDQVPGKHEFITYAVGITTEGKIQAVEILEYRESYGQQVKTESWRKQFVGKTKEASLKVGDDIKNISGATLSSSHVTAGVKRILQTYDFVRDRI